jgi:Flp pilus assembly protein TadG
MPERKTSGRRAGQRGQVIVLLAFALPMLLLSLGLAIDLGFAFVTKAKLSKAVDAACLTAMRNLSQGQARATTLALSSFNANYGSTAFDFSPPTVSVAFSTGSNGQTLVTINATAIIKTYFMAILPEDQTLSVSDTAQATRGKLVMTVVLDRSGSMTSNGGSRALPPATISFINYFDNVNDKLAMASFASSASVDYSIGTGFIAPITSAVNAMSFAGGTFGLGGLTLAKAQNDSVPVVAGDNVIKVVVYFTDGYVNTIQDTFNCTSSLGRTLYNYGGHDSGTSVDFYNPANGTDWGTVDSSGYPKHSPSPDCTGVTKFTSQSTGTQKSFSRLYVTADAQYRSIAVTNAMRDEGMYVYSIGLGTSVDSAFLKQIANDPSSSSYNSNQPTGMAVFAPSCPSSTCTAELQQVFQTIAAQILLRLTQ